MAKATDMEICQTLVHEMCHLWQNEFGNPSRPGYHNKEWAAKMLSVGLTPSSTGQEGGRKVGQKMNDYPTPNGIFLKIFKRMSKELLLPFKSAEFVGGVLFINGLPLGDSEKSLKKKISRVKYTCSCGINVWAKPGITSLFCSDCQNPFLSKGVDYN